MIKDLTKLCFLPGSLLALKDGKYNYITLLKQGLSNLGVPTNTFDNPVLPALVSGATPTTKYWTLATGEPFLITRTDTTYPADVTSGLDLFIGRYAGNLTATGGGNNIAIGDSSMRVLTSAYGSIAMGLKSLYKVQTGNYNIAIGEFSQMENVSTSGLVGVGYQTLKNTTGGFNTAIGNSAMVGNTTGAYNTAVGADAQRNTTTVSTGSYNVSVGGATLRYMTTAAQNTAIGYHCGHSLSTGANNTYLGYFAGRNNVSGSGNVFLGSNAGTNETASNKLYINNAATGGLIHGDFSTGQVQINAASTPSLTSCAALDVISTTMGLLLPRMTKAQRDAIATPLAGLMVYQTDNTPGLRTYNGTNWMRYTETAD